jgi:ABC-2 type transport system permease protein
MTSMSDLVAIEQRPRVSAAGYSKLSALWALYVLTLRQHVHGKRWIVMTLLFLLPAALVLIVRRTAHDVPSLSLEFIFVFMFIPQALLPLVALIYSSGMIQDEQEEQTITYLLIRPIAKWAIYLCKLLATLTTTVCLTAIFTAVTYIAIYAGAGSQPESIPARCLTAISVHALAVVAYCCLFGLMSLFSKRALVMGILYIAIFEGLFANLAFGIRLLTVIYYARLIAYRSMSFVVPMGGGTQDIAADAWQLNITSDPQLLDHPQTSTCLTVLLLASLCFALLAAFICSRREFHVKTPEKSGN